MTPRGSWERWRDYDAIGDPKVSAATRRKPTSIRKSGSHKGEAASPDLLIVGAYPGGRGPDMRIPGKGAREQALANIAAVPPPAIDPVYGRSGPLIERRRTGVQR